MEEGAIIIHERPFNEQCQKIFRENDQSHLWREDFANSASE